MNRRRFLGVTAVTTAATAGYVVRWHGDEAQEKASPAHLPGVDLPVPAEEIEVRLPKDGISAIVDPAFGPDWSDLNPDGIDDPTLPEETAVIGVERDGHARAYPLRVLDWHEIVNDTFGGPIAVTYCVLCGSSVVVERRVGGESTIFGVSGRLWRDDLVMYDKATESLWSQIFAAAIRGPRTGDRLAVIPSTLSSWGEWRRAHPRTEVLLPPPDSVLINGAEGRFPYFSSKYNYETESQLIGVETDSGRGPRTLVIGVSDGANARAYPFEIVAKQDVITDTVGEIPVVVALAPGGTLVAYERRLDGYERTVEPAGEHHISVAGSRFDRLTGTAVDGPYDGSRLEHANEHPPMFWRGWSNFYPETTVYHG